MFDIFKLGFINKARMLVVRRRRGRSRQMHFVGLVAPCFSQIACEGDSELKKIGLFQHTQF